jgi:hypothetical protein
MPFRIVGNVTSVETIAVEHSIREIERLRKWYGPGRWRKMKGIALVELPNGEALTAEIHWYEAHGIGRREVKIKHLLDE